MKSACCDPAAAAPLEEGGKALRGKKEVEKEIKPAQCLALRAQSSEPHGVVPALLSLRTLLDPH